MEGPTAQSTQRDSHMKGGLVIFPGVINEADSILLIMQQPDLTTRQEPTGILRGQVFEGRDATNLWFVESFDL